MADLWRSSSYERHTHFYSKRSKMRSVRYIYTFSGYNSLILFIFDRFLLGVRLVRGVRYNVAAMSTGSKTIIIFLPDNAHTVELARGDENLALCH